METTTKPRIVINIPTYNEIENIPQLLEEISQVISDIPQYEIHILFIDDMSPDGTGKLIKQYKQTNPQIHLITGQKNGLGVAYIRGFKFSIEELGADFVMEMDADLSHDPKVIPQFLQKIEEGSDFVIGSRYIPGGSIPEDWGLHRKLNSKFGNLFASWFLKLKNAKDCTSGYRLISTALLNKLQFNNLETKGYSFQVSLLYEAVRVGAVVSEVPIQFKDRIKGQSKLRFADIVEFIKYCLKVRFKK